VNEAIPKARVRQSGASLEIDAGHVEFDAARRGDGLLELLSIVFRIVKILKMSELNLKTNTRQSQGCDGVDAPRRHRCARMETLITF